MLHDLKKHTGIPGVSLFEVHAHLERCKSGFSYQLPSLSIKFHEWLLQGINPNLVLSNGLSLLCHASQWDCSAGLIKDLLKRGADVNYRSTTEGLTPLYLGVSAGLTQVVEQLLASGADARIRTPSGATALSVSHHKLCEWQRINEVMYRRHLDIFSILARSFPNEAYDFAGKHTLRSFAFERGLVKALC